MNALNLKKLGFCLFVLKIQGSYLIARAYSYNMNIKINLQFVICYVLGSKLFYRNFTFVKNSIVKQVINIIFGIRIHFPSEKKKYRST